jgi:hypothetical protein
MSSMLSARLTKLKDAGLPTIEVIEGPPVASLYRLTPTRNQIAAVIGALVYLFVLEPLINIIPVVQNVYPYLPGAAAAAITGATRGSGSSHLDALQGALVLLGWGLLFAVGGWIFTIRRDVP